jgi:hypothetical protein
LRSAAHEKHLLRGAGQAAVIVDQFQFRKDADLPGIRGAHSQKVCAHRPRSADFGIKFADCAHIPFAHFPARVSPRILLKGSIPDFEPRLHAQGGTRFSLRLKSHRTQP